MTTLQIVFAVFAALLVLAGIYIIIQKIKGAGKTKLKMPFGIEITSMDPGIVLVAFGLMFGFLDFKLDRKTVGPAGKPDTIKTAGTTNPGTHIDPPSSPVPTPLNPAKYFHPGEKPDIAILVTGNSEGSNMGDSLKNYFRAEKINASNSFFTLDFKLAFAGKLLNDDHSVLSRLNLGKNIRCLFFVHQNVSFKKNDSPDGPAVTATGKYEFRLMHLKEGNNESFVLSGNGAGGDVQSAQTDLDEKIIYQLQQRIRNFQL